MILTKHEQIILLKVKSLLNHLSYFVHKEHKPILNDYHKICRKYCRLNLKED